MVPCRHFLRIQVATAVWIQAAASPFIGALICAQGFFVLDTFLWEKEQEMDPFQQSVGYRSLLPALYPPEKSAIAQLSEGELLQVATHSFDASLAEILRSTAEWHWKTEVRDVAEHVAEMLSFRDSSRYERMRSALLHYYTEHYRCPPAREYRAYISEHHPRLLQPKVTASCYSDDHIVEVPCFDATLWCTQATAAELRALRNEGYGGDYAADDVAEFMVDCNPSVQAVFDHNATLPQSIELRGFECHVNEEQFEAWIAQHRPYLLAEEEEAEG